MTATVTPTPLPYSLPPTRFPSPMSKNFPRCRPGTIACSRTDRRPDIIDSRGRIPKLILPGKVSVRRSNDSGGDERVEKMSLLCGLGYWVNGFRCFPWLALNFHMAHHLRLTPSALQLVQNFGNLPTVAKPLYGILSDAVYVRGAHRLPYISAGVLLQILSWASLASISSTRESLPNLVLCVLLSNLGASVSEVAMDALVAEYGQKQKLTGLQSYAFMASAVGGILGNLLGGYVLMKMQPNMMFLLFSVLLTVKFALSSLTEEASPGVSSVLNHSVQRKSILRSIWGQASELAMMLGESRISRPLLWIVASNATILLLSGSIFCYQTQCLNLNPSVIGMSRVVGQLLLLFMSVIFDRYFKYLSMRKLIGVVQGMYACSLLLDLVLVKQINLLLGIPNEAFVLFFSGLAETVAQFKLLPFSVHFASLCPRGCEGSLTSFLASAMCLSSIVSGFLGVGLASLIGITPDDYSRLPVGILLQFIVALLPLSWISLVPSSPSIIQKHRKRVSTKRIRRTKKDGRLSFGSILFYRRQIESQA
ncbi:hypothetical protein MLD38_011938 [Melastoma candidum]|uniref:Uncharacterized protein n=1 Tax=Melastoma candidum TaxID=119954 RepID=A0ACB9R4P4_9MYRT|nr:hypothetical protein MLD38_011938 [Melastoma candidum]